MRRRWATSILAIGAVLAVAGAGIATAYTPTIIKESNLPVFLNGGFKPTRLPKKKLAPIHLTVEGEINSLDGSHPPPLTEVVFEIDKNVAFNAKGLAVCRGRSIDLPTERGDPCKEARVGKGEMEVEIQFPEQPPFDMKSHLVAYNGVRAGGVRTIFVLGYLSNPVSAAVVTTVKVSKIHNGRYGTKLVATIPPIAGEGAVRKFQLEFFRQFAYRHKKQSYLLAKCPDGKLQVHWDAIFRDGTDSPGIFRRPCTPIA
jgi:hypothetical protein